ncbi:MAG: hypothetical protein H0T73_05555 [Ardenticatenales bacterium]|nr:hypothetical protein [Ardenticatenales bacterium]
MMILAPVIPLSAFTAPVSAAEKPYTGRVTNTYTNCGITQVMGVVLNRDGTPQVGAKVRLWWPNGQTLHATAGQYVRSETNAAGWDFTLNTIAVANTWYVAIEDSSGNLLSDPIEVRTSASCNPGDANAARVEFRNSPQPAPQQPPAPNNPAPILAPPGAGIAPPVAAGATCQFYAQAGGFSVCDDTNANFLAAFRRYGLQNVGYPISQRFSRDGFITQAFQKAVFQWRPDSRTVALVNVFDELHRGGLDQTLNEKRQTPFQLAEGWEGPNATFQQAVQMRQALLSTRPALRTAYFAVSDPMTFFGLPTSEVTDMGNHYAIRTQRAVLQEWKQDVPWARAGQVTVANGGDIAKELGHLPAAALTPDNGTPVSGVPAPVPPVTAPAPAPVAAEPGRNLDSRLGALGVGIQPANVAVGQQYWRVTEILWHDIDQSGGRHSIYVDALDESGNRVVGQTVTIAWASGSQQLVMEPKPFPEYGANFPMYAHSQAYTIYIDGIPSERVTGMGLGNLDKRNWNMHVEYLIKYQRVTKR